MGATTIAPGAWCQFSQVGIWAVGFNGTNNILKVKPLDAIRGDKDGRVGPSVTETN